MQGQNRVKPAGKKERKKKLRRRRERELSRRIGVRDYRHRCEGRMTSYVGWSLRLFRSFIPSSPIQHSLPRFFFSFFFFSLLRASFFFFSFIRCWRRCDGYNNPPPPLRRRRPWRRWKRRSVLCAVNLHISVDVGNFNQRNCLNEKENNNRGWGRLLHSNLCVPQTSTCRVTTPSSSHFNKFGFNRPLDVRKRLLKYRKLVWDNK